MTPTFTFIFYFSLSFKHRIDLLRSLEDGGERYEDQYDAHGVLLNDQVMSKRGDSDILQN